MNTITASEADPFWRWHDAVGLTRPGLSLAAKLRREKRKAVAEVVPKKQSGLEKAHVDLAAAKKRLAEVDVVRAAEWHNWCAGKRRSPYGELTVREWRRLNAQVAYYEHALLPYLEALDLKPFRRPPPPAPPSDHWSGDDFVPNVVLVARAVPMPVVQRPAPKPRPAGPTSLCVWCKTETPIEAITIEHVIPRWARSLTPALVTAAKTAPACNDCNNAKGAMPPALFASIRHDAERVRAQNIAWQEVARKFSKWTERKSWTHLVPEIEREMLREV